MYQYLKYVATITAVSSPTSKGNNSPAWSSLVGQVQSFLYKSTVSAAKAKPEKGFYTIFFFSSHTENEIANWKHYNKN